MREPSADWADTCADTPNWRDNPDELARLCEYGAMQLHDPIDPRLHDLRGQGLTAVQLHTITDIAITGSYLMTPDQEIRAATNRLRTLATAATPGPWEQTGIGDYGWAVTFGRSAAGVETEDSDQGRADADYIAAMHPGVAKALIGWLEVEEFRVLHNGRGPELHHALAVARAINTGGQP